MSSLPGLAQLNTLNKSCGARNGGAHLQSWRLGNRLEKLRVQACHGLYTTVPSVHAPTPIKKSLLWCWHPYYGRHERVGVSSWPLRRCPLNLSRRQSHLVSQIGAHLGVSSFTGLEDSPRVFICNWFSILPPLVFPCSYRDHRARLMFPLRGGYHR